MTTTPEALRELGAGYTEWRVQDKDGAYCIAFSRGDGYSIDPEREAREWLARQKREFPGGRYATGYEVAEVRVQTSGDKALCEAADTIDRLTRELAEARAEAEALRADAEARCIEWCKQVQTHHQAKDGVDEVEQAFIDGEACGAEDCIEAIKARGNWPGAIDNARQGKGE